MSLADTFPLTHEAQDRVAGRGRDRTDVNPFSLAELATTPASRRRQYARHLLAVRDALAEAARQNPGGGFDEVIAEVEDALAELQRASGDGEAGDGDTA